METKTTWTIMVYIAADGTLANFAVESLKQLNTFASTNGNAEPKIIVGAHFAFPAGATKAGCAGQKTALNAQTRTGHHILLKKGGGANNNICDVLKLADGPEIANIPPKEALKRFLESAYKDPESKAENYALILWGHGPELLLQPPVGNQTSNSNRMYVTPEELREVLEACPPPNGRRLNIIGFDACFMSMLEMACELQGLAEFMVASQDEVPDTSFPYDKLAELFRKHGKDTPLLLKDGVAEYLDTYADYIFDTSTGINPVTLSALRLDKCKDIMEAVKALASALLAEPNNERFRNRLIEARRRSKDYASGLYVDLSAFCAELLKLDVSPTIVEACKEVVNCALKLSPEGKSDGLILKNVSADGGSNGVSIYLPYLSNQQYDQVSRPLVKGGPELHTAKGFGAALNGAAIEYLMCARRDLILDTESYYGGLKFVETGWYRFITEVWTRALIETSPADLDYHYSAQQSWMNITRAMADAAKARPGDTADSSKTQELAGVK